MVGYLQKSEHGALRPQVHQWALFFFLFSFFQLSVLFFFVFKLSQWFAAYLAYFKSFSTIGCNRSCYCLLVGSFLRVSI